MKGLLGLVCFIAPLISLEADKCKERPHEVVLFSSVNEIDVRACPLNPNEKVGPIIWYKNDSKTPISMEPDARIHQQKENLWFVPAKLEDSGHYYCAVRNATYCLKLRITTEVLENEPDLCFNTQAVFPQRLYITADGSLVCPYLDYFKDENNDLPKVQWYKDCEPLLLDNTSFVSVTNKLIVKDVTEEHRGNYTCQISYTHLGKQYHATRVIEFLTEETPKPEKPVIVSPTNETMEAVLGSKIKLICNVTGQLSDLVYWKWNGSEIDDPKLREDHQYMINPLAKKRSTLITTLNILEVKRQFYLLPFVCFVKNTDSFEAAYIQLIKPVPDFKYLIIGISVTVIAVIVCSVFVYKIFKVDIVLWYRDYCSDFLPPKASDGKTYDAYILYPKTFSEGSTSNLHIFVFKLLPEVLEKQLGYKLFIYGRDDCVGEDAIEVTNENIRKSRSLIIILVRNIASFSWLGHSSEEQIVMYNAFIQDGIKVILLELEKIQDYEKMPESIKFIKQKQGTIRWSGDFKDEQQSAQTRFWKHLRYHMPAQRPTLSKHQLLSPDPPPDAQEKLPGEMHLPLRQPGDVGKIF